MIVFSIVLLLLTYVSLEGVYAYRNLTANIGKLSYEVQELWSLGQDVSELRSYFRRGPLSVVAQDVQRSASASQRNEFLSLSDQQAKAWLQPEERISFLNQLSMVIARLNLHKTRVGSHLEDDPLLASSAAELQIMDEMLRRLRQVQQWENEYHNGQLSKSQKIADQLDDIALDAHSLFNLLTDRMRTLRAEVRASYNAWLAIIAVSGIVLALIIGFSYWFMRKQVVQPFKVLLSGSRRIAGETSNIASFFAAEMNWRNSPKLKTR